MMTNGIRRSALTVMVLCSISFSSQPALGDFIHPDCGIMESLLHTNNEYFDDAIEAAIDRLTEMGSENILICRYHRIEAPLGGYLIAGLFNLEIESEYYTTFRIGIEDGEPDTFFVFIARGMDRNSNVIWYPEPGPDYIPEENPVTPESFFAYEFLIDRNEFENLESEFPRPETVNPGE